MRLSLSSLLRCVFGFAIASAASAASAPQPDEAQLAGRPAASFPQASEDYFHDMDNGVPLNADQVKGRNMWIVWTGGNDRFWDKVTQNSLATFDLLKIVTSHPSQTYCDGQRCDRDSRWKWLGAISEPCFEKPTAPDPAHFGLWLDHRSAGCAPDPFENATNYPGVKIGQRGKAFKDGTTLPVGSYFGEATGILGLRLFPNPEFDESAKARWDPERYYSDYKYYTDPKLVRPYRVGMSCGFCHVGPSPIHPPADPSHPEYSNLNSTVGAQYLWMDRVFVWSADEKNFVYQLVHSYLPGTMDTSLVSTDYINNPRTMNAVYLLGERLRQAHIWGKERLEGNERQNKQLPGTFDPPGDFVVAARAQGRRGFGRRARRAEPRLHQYRALQRRLDDSLQSVLRVQTDHPDRHSDGREIFLLLARDRGGHAIDGRLPGRRGPAGQARRRSGRRQISQRGRRRR